MAEEARRRGAGTDWLGLVSFGFFVLLVGIVWVSTSNLADGVVTFVKDFRLQNVTEHIAVPAPENVNVHKVVYTAAMRFCIFFAIFEVAMLTLRLVLEESVERVADAVSGVAFWFSVGYFLNLLVSESIGWFGLVAGIIISGGLAIVVTSLVRLLR